MKRLSILALCLLAISCAKKAPQISYLDIFQQICEIEVQRHGPHPKVPVTEYGNIHMDTYAEQPGPESQLWQTFFRSEDVCRGAYLQLYFDNHRQDLKRHWNLEKDQLQGEDRARIMRLIRSRKVQDFYSLVLQTLRNDPSSLARHEAGLALAIFNRDKDPEAWRGIIRQEQDPEVLSAIALSLNIENGSPDLELLQEFGEVTHLPLAQAMISMIATAELDDKATYLEPLAQSANRQIANSAKSALESLKNKDKLSFSVKNIQPEPIPEAPRDMQLQYDLMDCLRKDDFETASALLEKGASIHHGTRDNISLLHQLAHNGSPAGIRWAVSQGAQLENIARDGQTPLMYTTLPIRYWEMRLETFVELGANLNAINSVGETALHIAARNNQGIVVRKLLELGANPDILDEAGRTALSTALLMGNDNLVEIFEDIKKAPGE